MNKFFAFVVTLVGFTGLAHAVDDREPLMPHQRAQVMLANAISQWAGGIDVVDVEPCSEYPPHNKNLCLVLERSPQDRFKRCTGNPEQDAPICVD